MPDKLISTPQSTDPGSDGSVGYEFQREVAVLYCIEMIECRTSEFVVCEFHEDIVKIEKGMQLELIQVKKRETGNWTLGGLLSPSGKARGILASLFFPIEVGKDIVQLRLCGFGRVSSEAGHGQMNLPELIALLATPEMDRDNLWQAKIKSYSAHIASAIEKQGISAKTVESGLRILSLTKSHWLIQSRSGKDRRMNQR